MSSGQNFGPGLLLALGLCLPCLLPILGIAVLSGVGVGAIGSFLSDNALLIAGIAAVVTLVGMAVGLIVRRGVYGNTGIRFLDRK